MLLLHLDITADMDDVHRLLSVRCPLGANAGHAPETCACPLTRSFVMYLLGCPVTDALLEQWSRHMVSPTAPFYLTDNDLHLLPPTTVLLTRAELAANYSDLPLEARDSYATYAVDRSAQWAALVDDWALLALPASARRSLFRRQWRLGRSQIYRREVVHEFCGRQAAVLDLWTVDTDDGDMVALHSVTWTTLAAEVRHRWLSWFVARDDPAGMEASPHDDVEAAWPAMDEPVRAIVRCLAGTFLPHSGPNCFSTTLAATMPGIGPASAVSRMWLHAAPFARALAAQGFRSTPFDSPPEAVAPPSVLIWGEDVTVAQHACFVPATGWALNKDAQGWFAPRQLLPLATIMDRWRHTGLPLTLYQRG